MGEFKAEKPATDFLHEFAALVEFKEPVVVAPVEDEDVALRVRGHRDGLTQVLARREFQEIRHRGEGDFRDTLDGCLALRECRRERQYEERDRPDENSFHRISCMPNFRMILYAKGARS